MDNNLVALNGSLITKEEKLKTLADSFLRGRKQTTHDAYQRDLGSFAEYLGVNDIQKACEMFVTQSHGDANAIALNFKAYMKEKGLAPTSINRRLASLRSFVKFCNTIGIVNWRLEVKNERVEALRDCTRGITLKAFQQLIKVAAKQENKEKSVRDVCLLRLFYDLGLRREEVRQLNYPSDVDLKAGTIRILGKGKTQKITLDLPVQTLEVVKSWVVLLGDSYEGPLFVGFDRSGKGKERRLTATGLTLLIRDLGKRVGLKLSPHKIRHLSCTEGIRKATEAGMDIFTCLDHSRHQSVDTLLIYKMRMENHQQEISRLVASEVTT